MRRNKTPISVAACLSLLLLQFSGLHFHADAAGFIGAPETSYAHGHDAHHDDHGHGIHGHGIHGHGIHGHSVHGSAAQGGDHPAHGDADAPDDHGEIRDVSLLESVVGNYKLPFAIMAPVLPTTVLPRTKTLASVDIAYPILSGRHTRWRPPLRAPPQHA